MVLLVTLGASVFSEIEILTINPDNAQILGLVVAVLRDAT
jgi:hypothetical protein